MSRINEKMGLPPAGKRNMMKLPTDRDLRNKLTAAKCPQCQLRGAILSKQRDRAGWFVCTWCYHSWEPSA